MAPTSDGCLPIHTLLNGRRNKIPVDAIKMLVECNRDMLKVSAGDSLGLPVHAAARRYDCSPTDDIESKEAVEITKYLLEVYPESTKSRTSLGAAPLDVAILQSRESMANVLLDADPEVATAVWGDTQITSFHIACKKSSLETIQRIHELHPHLIRQPNGNQELPVHFAISGMQEPAIVGFLFQAFPESIVARDQNGRLPLHVAMGAEEPQLWLVELLMKCYPTAIHTPTNEGKYPIQLLCDNRYFPDHDPDVFRFMARQLPYSIDRCDGEGRNILHLFCRHIWHGYYDDTAIETLTKLHELSPDAIKRVSDQFGLPMHAACQAGSSVKVLNHLVRLYPESIEHNHSALGLPLHCSARHESAYGEAFEFLLEKRYEIHADDHGKFLLHTLLADKQIDQKEMLVSRLIEVCEIRRKRASTLGLVSRAKNVPLSK